MLVFLGKAQLAQLAGCRGTNTQTNAACAGTTQAIVMSQDRLISGRARRLVVVAGDSTLLLWLGSSFRALGAATTTEAVVENAVLLSTNVDWDFCYELAASEWSLKPSKAKSNANPTAKSRPVYWRRSIPAQLFTVSYWIAIALPRKYLASRATLNVCTASPRQKLPRMGSTFRTRLAPIRPTPVRVPVTKLWPFAPRWGATHCCRRGFLGHPMGVLLKM